jgi:hypothetical protein
MTTTAALYLGMYKYDPKPEAYFKTHVNIIPPSMSRYSIWHFLTKFSNLKLC